MPYNSYPDYIRTMESSGFNHILLMRYYLPLSNRVLVGRSLDVVPASDGIKSMRSTLDKLLAGVEPLQKSGARVDIALDNNDIALYISARCDDARFCELLKEFFRNAGFPYQIHDRPKRSKEIADEVMDLPMEPVGQRR